MNETKSGSYTFGDAEQYTLYVPPKPVGYWVFPGSTSGYKTWISSSGKPNWLHRFTMRVILGFKWEDAK